MNHADEPGRALIPTGCDSSTYACVRSLADRGVSTVVASELDAPPAAASRYCEESVPLPDPREDLLSYRDALLALADRPDVRTVVPVRPADCYLLSRYRDAFAERTAPVVPSMDQLRTVHDRLELVRAAERAGVPVPETRLLSDVERWDRDRIVKSRYNVLADAFVDALGPRELDVVKTVVHVGAGRPPDRDALERAMGHDPIVQEHVRWDSEFLFAGLYDSGQPLATFQHRQLRGSSYTGGGGVYRRSTDDEALEAAGRALLDALDWHGLACIEFMRDAETGAFVLTELNPRLWQSLPSAIHAGAEFPYDYWLAATGRADEIEGGYRVGVGTHQLHGELGYLRSVLSEDSPTVSRPSVPRTLWEIASSVVREPRFDYLRLDDPGPFVAGLRHAFTK